MLCNLSKTHLVFPIATRVSSQSKSITQLPISNIHFFSHGSFFKPSQNPKPRRVFQCAQLGRRKGRLFSCAAESRDGDSLPWLGDGDVRDSRLGKNVNVKARRSSWEESAEKLVKKRSSWGESAEILEKKRSTWEESAEKLVPRSRSATGEEEVRGRRWVKGDAVRKEVESDEGGEAAVIEDPRWDRIKSRIERVVYHGSGSERPETRRFSRQENWGRKTFKQATESSLPKMAGEGVYGVGPVLAALTAGRREFYVLYVQESLDLSGNNRKKKDKKGFEKVLRMADKIGLSVKEVSKHALNMLVDNRPHQGLLLDGSPLEMVNVKELEPVSADEEDKGLLWVALDEVTDPQNLGAIIRSSYFFGAAGVILCAKNSAPLSGVVSKASAGSLELMELRSCKNMMQFLTSSAENGWRVLGGSVYSRAVPLDEVSPGRPTILVLGSEGTGLRPLVERSCTQLVRIPGNIPVDLSARDVADDEEEGESETETETGHLGASEEFRSFLAVESLNVSVAAGVLLNHLIGSNYRTHNHHQSSNDANDILQ